MDNRKEIVENILSELNGRRGFDDWWYNIDEDIRNEITETLVNLLPIDSVMPRILHFEDEFGRLFDADSEDILFEGTPNEEPRFYVLDYAFRKNYLTVCEAQHTL